MLQAVQGSWRGSEQQGRGLIRMHLTQIIGEVITTHPWSFPSTSVYRDLKLHNHLNFETVETDVMFALIQSLCHQR